jgi:hypothetical protein
MQEVFYSDTCRAPKGQSEPIFCELPALHLGNHATLSNSQFQFVTFYKDVLTVSWPNESDARFGEMHDSAVLAGMRRELGGSFDNMRDIRNNANQFAPDHWTGYDAGTGMNEMYWYIRRDNAAFWSAMLSRSKDQMILAVTLDN